MTTQSRGFPIGKDASVQINSVDLTDHVRSGLIHMAATELDSTGWGDAGMHKTGGLRDDRFEFTLMQNFAASEVDATLAPLFENETAFVVNVVPNGGDNVSATNPQYQGTCKIFTYPPYSGEVGARADVAITLPVEGTISRNTST